LLSNIRNKLSFEGLFEDLIEPWVQIGRRLQGVCTLTKRLNWGELLSLGYQILSDHWRRLGDEFVLEGVIVILDDLDARLELVDLSLHE
jgi:hypothetical protein